MINLADLPNAIIAQGTPLPFFFCRTVIALGNLFEQFFLQLGGLAIK